MIALRNSEEGFRTGRSTTYVQARRVRSAWLIAGATNPSPAIQSKAFERMGYRIGLWGTSATNTLNEKSLDKPTELVIL